MRVILKAVMAAGGLALLAGCTTPKPVVDPATPGAQACSATTGQSLVGSHVGAVDFAASADVRIVCTTCAATDDFRPNRINIRFDKDTGIIKKVDCG